MIEVPEINKIWLESWREFNRNAANRRLSMSPWADPAYVILDCVREELAQ